MKDNFRRLLPKLAQLVWVISVVFVSYLSLSPQIELPFEFKGVDKACHSLAYLWLAAIPFFGFERSRIALAVAFLMLLFGIGLEYAQDFVPGRFFSVADMAANSIGVVLGVFFGRYLKPRFWMRLHS